VVRRDPQVGVPPPEGPDLQRVGRHAPDEEHRRLEPPGADDGAQEVGGVALVQTGDDVRERLALVLQVDHVGLREDRAPAGHRRRRLAREPLAQEALEKLLEPPLVRLRRRRSERGGETLGLLVDERTRP
jgi:hypothetical protein